MRAITTRTSTFVFCRMSETDPHFPRYPSLPVISCAGYRKQGDTKAERPDHAS